MRRNRYKEEKSTKEEILWTKPKYNSVYLLKYFKYADIEMLFV